MVMYFFIEIILSTGGLKYVLVWPDYRGNNSITCDKTSQVSKLEMKNAANSQETLQ